MVYVCDTVASSTPHCNQSGHDLPSCGSPLVGHHLCEVQSNGALSLWPNHASHFWGVQVQRRSGTQHPHPKTGSSDKSSVGPCPFIQGLSSNSPVLPLIPQYLVIPSSRALSSRKTGSVSWPQPGFSSAREADCCWPSWSARNWVSSSPFNSSLYAWPLLQV